MESGAVALAEQCYLEALAILEPMEARAGPDNGRRYNIAWARTSLAQIYARTDRLAESRELFDISGRMWRELCDNQPGNKHCRLSLLEWKRLCPFDDLLLTIPDK